MDGKTGSHVLPNIPIEIRLRYIWSAIAAFFLGSLVVGPVRRQAPLVDAFRHSPERHHKVLGCRSLSALPFFQVDWQSVRQISLYVLKDIPCPAVRSIVRTP
jgi:hypothetical protein